MSIAKNDLKLLLLPNIKAVLRFWIRPSTSHSGSGIASISA
ncbi:hypothetical protein [Mesorhizobium sp.]|nr:hypothetical protein [Mesorhizobium sp.]